MKVKHYVLFAFTARKAGWYLLLPPLRAYCWQTDCRHSGGEEPEKDGCWWPIRYVCVKICSKLCRLVKVENQLIFCWRSLGWEGKGSCTLPECCGLCFLESWGMTEYIRTNSRLKKKKITIHFIPLQDKVWSVTQSDDSASSLYFPSLLLPRDKYRLFRQEKKSDYNSYCLFNLTKCEHFIAVLQIIGNRRTRHRLPCWLLFEVLGRLFLHLKGSSVIAYTCRVRGALHLHAHQKSKWQSCTCDRQWGWYIQRAQYMPTALAAFLWGEAVHTVCDRVCATSEGHCSQHSGTWAVSQQPGAAPCRFLFSAASGIWTQVIVLLPVNWDQIK